MGEPALGLVQLARPASEVGEPGVTEQVRVDVDDLSGEVVEHLSPARIEPVHPRDGAEPGRTHVLQQRVHGRGPRPGRPAYRLADPHRAADVAAGQLLAVQEHLAQLGQEGPVRLEPVDVVELLGGEPAQPVVVVAGAGLALDQAAAGGPQDVGVADRLLTLEPRVDLHPAAELLGDLADHGRLGRLAGIDLASRQLPASGGLRGPGTPGGEQRAASDHGGPDHQGHRRASRGSAPSTSAVAPVRVPAAASRAPSAPWR